ESVHITLDDLDLNSIEETAILPLNLKEVREQAEILAIKRALNHSHYNISQTSKVLGISRPTLYNLLNKYAIEAIKEI
ncbi:MAG: helix-turn-helix domain-containing protein, partial [Gammaproteobacteria bacterium]|nr:helix-turn-helix domain-containing protein [Gammaproteobacteria bacterium]